MFHTDGLPWKVFTVLATLDEEPMRWSLAKVLFCVEFDITDLSWVFLHM